MALRRKININGAIDNVSFLEFSKRLTALEAAGEGDIEVELHSEGGEAYAALAYAGRIRTSKCRIVIRAYGLVASAAVLILASGDIRCLEETAWVMVHEDEGSSEGSVSSIEASAKQLRRMETQWYDLLESLTDTSAEVWGKLHKDTTYLTAEECLTLKLVDKII